VVEVWGEVVTQAHNVMTVYDWLKNKYNNKECSKEGK
jgi:hypothetical protein